MLTVASPSLVYMLGYMATASAVNILAIGGKGESVLSFFKIWLKG